MKAKACPPAAPSYRPAPLPIHQSAEGFELYDLNADPHEVDNLFDRAPRSLIAALQGQLSLLKASAAACRWVSAGAACLRVLVGAALAHRRHERPAAAAQAGRCRLVVGLSSCWPIS